MGTVAIKSIRIDTENRLLVWPDTTDRGYQFIWRDASGVRWDDVRECLYSEVPNELSHAAWFGLLVESVQREYGDVLQISDLAEWINVASETKTEIEERYER